MGKVEAAIFDMDGLLADSEPVYFQAESDVASHYGKEFTRDIMEKMMGHKAVRSIEIMIDVLGINRPIEEVLMLRDASYRDLLLAGVAPMPGVFDLLDWLEDRGYRKAVATSSRPEFKDIIFTHLDLHDRFEVVVTGDEVSEGKPSPEVYRTALSRLGLEPRQCVVLEDSEAGLGAGKRAGCLCIVVPNEFTRHQDFSQADLVAPHLFHGRIREFFETH